MAGKKQPRKVFKSKRESEVLLEEITEDEIYDGHTIASALNFNLLGLAVSVSQASNDRYGLAKDLSPLGDMVGALYVHIHISQEAIIILVVIVLCGGVWQDGSLDLCAYDADGKLLRLFISTKSCPYQSVPTKVLPFHLTTRSISSTWKCEY